MLAVVYGFPTKKEALAFEWNWQKPFTSKSLRGLANDLVAQKTLGNRWKLKFKIRIMFEMLQISPWNRYPLIIQWLGRNPLNTPSLFPSFPSPPSHVKQIYAPLSELDMGLENETTDDPNALESGEEDHSDDDAPLVPHFSTSPPTIQPTLSATQPPRGPPSPSEGPPLSALSAFSHRHPDSSLSLARTSSGSVSASHGEAAASRPRRSLSANALFASPPPLSLATEVIDFHNRSIDDDDDSFLHVPAFAAKPVSAAPKKTASLRPSPTPPSLSTAFSATPSTQAPLNSAAMDVDPPTAVICKICHFPIHRLNHGLSCSKDGCLAPYHIVCWANQALKEEKEAATGEFVSLVPTSCTCPLCHHRHRWMDLIRNKQRTLQFASNPLRSLSDHM